MKSPFFWDTTPCSPLSVNRRFGGTYGLHIHFRKDGKLLRWFLAQLIFSNMKMEAVCSSETSVDTQRATWRYIPEKGTPLPNSFPSSINIHIIV
jgi:hypothetical protein